MGAPILLQSYPRGYLGWLRQRIGGAAPDQVATVLQPTIDAGKLYRELRADRQSITYSQAVNSSAVGWIVPSNERWELMTLSVFLDIPTVSTAVCALACFSPTGENFFVSPPLFAANASAITRTQGINATLLPNWLLDPGTSIGVVSLEGAVGAGPFVGYLTASWYSMDV